MNVARGRIVVSLLAALVLASRVFSALPEDIRALSQHFNEPGAPLAPWLFFPQSNIKELSTADHPGLLSVWEADKGEDIKGVLDEPIPIDQYHLPWECQVSYMQNFSQLTGRNKNQVNYAYGINLGVTFSDPPTWPKDRTTPPADMRTVQLLVVHLGNYGEQGPGLPQYSTTPAPEAYLVCGRGDLGHAAMGDWEIPYVWIGDGAVYAGPASNQLFYRVVVASPTMIRIGIKFEAGHGWNMRDIDLSGLGTGPITGVWELGPVISCDDWIPGTLARSIPVKRGINQLMTLMRGYDDFRKTGTDVLMPEVLPPDPQFPYYLDYCVFLGSEPMPLEHFSDEFNIPGYLGQWQIQPQSTIVETYSHPGHLTMTMLGPSLGTGFSPVGASDLSLKNYAPPWEVEWGFVPPRTKGVPWNIFCNFVVLDEEGRQLGVWQPGFQYFPEEQSAGYINHMNRASSPIDPQFATPPPPEVMNAETLYLLLQVVSPSVFRVGVRSDPAQPWIMTEPYDLEKATGRKVGVLGLHCYSSVQGKEWGGPSGTPVYQQVQFDYLRYRYGLSVK